MTTTVRMRRRAMLAGGAAALAGPTRAAPGPAGWRAVFVPGRAEAHFAALPEGAIGLRALGAMGFLVRAVDPAEQAGHDVRLAWRWRVLAAPPPSDLADPDAGDRPAAVHVLFAEAGGGGLGARLRRGLRGALLGAEFSGRALTHVWGGRAPSGTILANPHLRGDGVLLIRRGPETALGAWQEERADLARDYRAAFAAAAPPATHLVLSIDTDDRGGLAAAEITPPRFIAA